MLARTSRTKSPRERLRSSRMPGRFVIAAKTPRSFTPSQVPPAWRSSGASTLRSPISQKRKSPVSRSSHSSRLAAIARGTSGWHLWSATRVHIADLTPISRLSPKRRLRFSPRDLRAASPAGGRVRAIEQSCTEVWDFKGLRVSARAARRAGGRNARGMRLRRETWRRSDFAFQNSADSRGVNRCTCLTA